MIKPSISALELCAGAGGQALGLEQAGFGHAGLVEIERHCCNSLRLNRPGWQVFEKDVREFAAHDADTFKGIDLLVGGLPLSAVFDSWQAARGPRRAQPVPGRPRSGRYHTAPRGHA